MIKLLIHIYRCIEAKFYELIKSLPKKYNEHDENKELGIEYYKNRLYMIESQFEKVNRNLQYYKHLSLNRTYNIAVDKDIVDIHYIIKYGLYDSDRFSNLMITPYYIENQYIVRDMEMNIATRILEDDLKYLDL